MPPSTSVRVAMNLPGTTSVIYTSSCAPEEMSCGGRTGLHGGPRGGAHCRLPWGRWSRRSSSVDADPDATAWWWLPTPAESCRGHTAPGRGRPRFVTVLASGTATALDWTFAAELAGGRGSDGAKNLLPNSRGFDVLSDQHVRPGCALPPVDDGHSGRVLSVRLTPDAAALPAKQRRLRHRDGGDSIMGDERTVTFNQHPRAAGRRRRSRRGHRCRAATTRSAPSRPTGPSRPGRHGSGRCRLRGGPSTR